MNTLNTSVVAQPRRLTIQYFVRGLVALARRRGHGLDTLLEAVRTEFNRSQD